jgi:hypothetical protein
MTAAYPMIYKQDQIIEGVSWASNLGRSFQSRRLGRLLLLRFGLGQVETKHRVPWLPVMEGLKLELQSVKRSNDSSYVI